MNLTLHLEEINYNNGEDKFFLYFKIPKNGGQVSMHTVGKYGGEINSYPNIHYNLLLRNLAKQVFGGNPALDVFDKDRADQVPKWIKDKFYKTNNKETESKDKSKFTFNTLIMNEKYGWQSDIYRQYYDEVDTLDFYKLYKDYVCKEGVVMKCKNKSTPNKKLVVKRPVVSQQYNPLLLLVA